MLEGKQPKTTHTAVEYKNILWGKQNLSEYFFTCPNMTDLGGKLHVINCSN